MIAIAMVEAAVSFWMMVTLIEKLFMKKKKRGIAVIIVAIPSYFFSLYLDNIDTLAQFTHVSTYLCFYSIIGIPLAVILMSLRYRRKPA